MKRHRTPTRRVWLRGLLVSGLAMLAVPALAASGCPEEVKFGGPAQENLPDFNFSNGVWTPATVVINGQPSSPKENQGGVYQWVQQSGPLGTLSNANTPQVTFTAPDVGDVGATVILRLTVTGCGGTASGTYRINVTDAYDVVVNSPPHAVASASSASTTEGSIVTLDGSASNDPDGDALTYSWQHVINPGDPVIVLATPNQVTSTFAAPNVAATTTLTFRLTVSDGALSNSNTTDVSVVWTNDPPVAALTCPLEVDEGDEVFLDGSASIDGDNGIVSYKWTQLVGLPEVPGVDTWDSDTATFNSPRLGFQQIGIVPFQLTVTDASGAYDSAQCSIFIHDITEPLIFGAVDIEAEATSAAGAPVDYSLTAEDAVDGPLTPLLQCEPPSGSMFAIDTTPVVCHVSDSAGNVGFAGFNVKVSDTTAPLIDVHPPVGPIEATGPSGAVANYDLPLANDIVDGFVTVTCTPASGSTFALGTHPVSCSATDAHGNAAQSGFNVTVVDTTPPTIDPRGDIDDIEATGPDGAPVIYNSPATHDLVDGDGEASCLPASGSFFELGTTLVTCSASDEAGNHAQSTSFNVTVVDSTPPTIDPHGNVGPIEATSPLGAQAFYTSPATHDAVSGDGTATCAPTSGSIFALGDTTVTCTASDAAGNAATPTQFVVTVRDSTPPTIDPHADLLGVEATGPNGAAVSYASPATHDLVDGDGTATCAPASGSTFALALTLVTCSASDAAGNVAQGTQFHVTVVDTTAPVISYYPGDVSAIAGSNSSAVVNYTQPTAWDIVDGAVAVNCSPASGSTFPVGSNTVTCTATDSRGNTAPGSFKVNVSYAWNGFFKPVDMAPTLNTSKAGSAIPLKFNLGGNQGMSIMAAGYPKSAPMSCGGAVEDPLLETVTAGSSSLQYDASANQYIYVWKSEKSWAGTCRQIQVKLIDGNVHTANFSFK